VRFFPARYHGVYLDWMRNIRDWCISRQLWWGHRIPVYYTASGSAVAALSPEDAQAKAGDDPIVRQDEDVLDTWFSSGLWPFATLGWPDETADLARYYPTSVLVTSREILFLWVARMVMMGLDFRKDVPFRDVYIYATVLTEDGKRMSKSLGTGVDPMQVIGDRGADALRYTLFSQTGTNQDIRYSEKRTLDARNFCNKVWNASRFVLMNLEGYTGARPQGLDPVDRWILSRLAGTEQAVRQGFDAYDAQSACAALYRFFWNDLCDWYIEVSKARLARDAAIGARQVPRRVPQDDAPGHAAHHRGGLLPPSGGKQT
jgi:valyl-tRNA synthetase